MSQLLDYLRKQQMDPEAIDLLGGEGSAGAEGSGYSKPVIPEAPLNPGDEMRMYTPAQRAGIGDLDKKVLYDYILNSDKTKEFKAREAEQELNAPLKPKPPIAAKVPAMGKDLLNDFNMADLAIPGANKIPGNVDGLKRAPEMPLNPGDELKMYTPEQLNNPQIGDMKKPAAGGQKKVVTSHLDPANKSAAPATKPLAPRAPLQPTPIGQPQAGKPIPAGPTGFNALADAMRAKGINNASVKNRSMESGTDPDLIKYLLEKYQADSGRNQQEQKSLASSQLWNGVMTGANQIASGIAGVTPNFGEFGANVDRQMEKGLLTTKQNKQSADVLEAAAKLGQIKKMHAEDLKLGYDKIKSDKRNSDIKDFGEKMEPKQKMLDANDRFQRATGHKLEDLRVVGGDILTPDGKKLDLPGINVPGIGRIATGPGIDGPMARELKAAATDMLSIKIYDSSGKAITPIEQTRLADGMRMGSFDTEADLLRAMQDLRVVINKNMGNIEARYSPDVVSTYSERGGTTSKSINQPSSEGMVRIINHDTRKAKMVPREDLNKWLNTGTNWELPGGAK